MNRKNIEVIYEQKGNGRYVPREMEWEGRMFPVDRVIHSCRSVDGSYTGTRYTVEIAGCEKYLYRDGNEWYVILYGEETA